MKKNFIILLISLLLTIYTSDAMSGFSEGFVKGYLTGLNVIVIAPSVSTSAIAREIVRRYKMNIVDPSRTNHALVVVRSNIQYPLSEHYGHASQVIQDAGIQLNIAGKLAHVYVFKVNDNMSASSVVHYFFDASNY